MQKPISKEINKITHYARKFTLAGANELKRSALQCMLGDSALSQAELRELTAAKNDGEASAEDIGAAAQSHFRMPMVSVMMQADVARSLRLRHSLCNADGILKYKSVADLEDRLDADEAEELLALVNEANPDKTVKAELADAEKN